MDEGDIELTCPFQQPEAEGEQQTNGQKVADKPKGDENGETSEGQTKTKAAKKSVIGSVRRAVRVSASQVSFCGCRFCSNTPGANM